MAAKSDRKRKVEKCPKQPSKYYGQSSILLGLLAGLFGLLHYFHVSTLFENDRHFSHLSEIEREMSFRTEMGMYYSYYKTIVASDTFLEGIRKIQNDNSTQYPDTINAIKKFNLFPEVVVGFLYHSFKSLGLIQDPQCWQVERGAELSPVMSCEGLGEPVYLYLEAVWYCSFVTVAALFLYATYLSETIFGGVIAVGLFFYNHSDCTRIQWTPPLRENFAYPLLLCQMHNVTTIIGNYARDRKLPWLSRVNLNMLVYTLLSLLCWQFSQFVFLTQLFALLILKWLGIVPNEVYAKISVMHVIPVVIFVVGTESSLMLCSLFTCTLLTSNTFALLVKKFPKKIALPLEIFGTLVGTKLLKSSLLNSEDDAHVFDLLRAKLTSYKTFHTMLYTCSSEFDFLPLGTYEALVKSFVLPTAIISTILALYYWYRTFKVKGYPECVEIDVAYNLLQTGAFVVMAVLIMRLKLFMTPHLCIVAGLYAKSRYLELFGIRSARTRVTVLVLVFACMTVPGVRRVQEEHGFVGEYSNVEQEELLEWIQNNTPSGAVFAGKMSLMANIMLSTNRPIVNNPYYEDKEMRDRTMKVYEMFSRKPVSTVYNTLLGMGVDYIALEEVFCYDVGNPTPGCKMTDLWDHVDETNRDRPPVCPTLFHGDLHPFRRVFVNWRYVVLRLERSTSIELEPTFSTHYQI